MNIMTGALEEDRNISARNRLVFNQEYIAGHCISKTSFIFSLEKPSAYSICWTNVKMRRIPIALVIRQGEKFEGATSDTVASYRTPMNAAQGKTLWTTGNEPQ
jgi:hypothetical protein